MYEPSLEPFEPIREVLAKSVHFNTLPAGYLDRLARLGTAVYFKSDKLIHPAWQPARNLWLVVSGGIRIVLPGEDGSSFTVAVAGQGDYYSAGSFVPAAIVASEAYALRHTELAVFDMKHVYEEFSHDDQMSQHVLELMHKRLTAAMLVYRDTLVTPLPRRVARRLLAQIATIADATLKTEIVSYVSQNELAEMLGASRSSVNAELRRLESSGAIRLGYRKIVVKDTARLLKAAGSGAMLL
jgi:CRP/FNR family transcriptional regulator, cyclic AMP receptor protein